MQAPAAAQQSGPQCSPTAAPSRCPAHAMSMLAAATAERPATPRDCDTARATTGARPAPAERAGGACGPKETCEPATGCASVGGPRGTDPASRCAGTAARANAERGASRRIATCPNCGGRHEQKSVRDPLPMRCYTAVVPLPSAGTNQHKPALCAVRPAQGATRRGSAPHPEQTGHGLVAKRLHARRCLVLPSTTAMHGLQTTASHANEFAGDSDRTAIESCA